MAHDVKQPRLKLPVLAASPVDIARLARELQAIDDSLLQLRLRKDKQAVGLPKTSQLLDQTVQLNKLDLLQAADRKLLGRFLDTVHKQAPVLHVSFSADPPVSFIEKLMTWLRREIHPQVLLTIGLQPGIGAGCMIRSANRYFDFSLRHRFDNQREVLVQKLRSIETPSQEARP